MWKHVQVTAAIVLGLVAPASTMAAQPAAKGTTIVGGGNTAKKKQGQCN